MKILEKKFQHNELNTIFLNSPGATIGCVQIWFKAGSALETGEELGIAHFLEHMFFKGKVSGQKDGQAKTIVDEVESFGGEMNAFTSFDYTCYYINAPKDHLLDALPLLLQMISYPKFEDDDILPEREVVYEEYLRSIDQPGQYAFSRLQKLCFTGNYAHQILGSDKSIKSFDASKLYSFRNRYYNKTNALLVIAGDLTSDKLNSLSTIIEKYSLPDGDSSSFQPFKLSNKSSFEVHQKDVNMAQLTLTFEALPYLHPNVGHEDLALNCLGHGETSRLYRELVHRTALANNAYCSSMYLADGGVHIAKITAPVDNFHKIYQLFTDTVLDIVSSRPFDPQKEISKIKNQYIASKIYEKESLEAFSFSLGSSYMQTGNINGENLFIEKIKESSPEQVHEGFGAILRRPLHAILQIPKTADMNYQQKSLKNFQQNFQQKITKALDKTQVKAHGKTKQLSSKKTKSKYDSSVVVIPLKEGVKLIYRQNKLTPTFVLHSYLKGGLAYENRKNNGYHHLISEVICKGHSNISYQKIQASLEEKSASLSGICGKNAYGLIMHGQSKDFSSLLGHFFGSINDANFCKREVNYERRMTYRSIDAQKKDPVKQCFKRVNATLFENHPYALDAEGDRPSLKNVTPEMLQKLHHDNLRKHEMLFTYCGDLDLDTVVRQLEDHQKNLKRGTGALTRGLMQKNKMPKVFGKTVHIPFDREQTQIFVGLPTFEMTNQNDIYIKILATYLSGQSSELFSRMRDQLGLCYTVSPVHFSALNGGYFGIYMASSSDKSQKAVLELRKMLSKIGASGLTAQEFERTKKIINGQMQINIQTNDDYANLYSIPELHGMGLDFIYENNRRIAQSKLKDFNSFITEFISEDWNLFLVGKEAVEKW